MLMCLCHSVIHRFTYTIYCDWTKICAWVTSQGTCLWFLSWSISSQYFDYTGWILNFQQEQKSVYFQYFKLHEACFKLHEACIISDWILANSAALSSQNLHIFKIQSSKCFAKDTIFIYIIPSQCATSTSLQSNYLTHSM